MKAWQAYCVFLSIALFWGLGFPLTKDALGELAPMSFMAIRFSIASVVLAAAGYSQIKRLTKQELVIGVGLGSCLSIGYILQTIGLESTSSGKTGFITSLNILMVPVFGSLLFGNRVLLKDKIGVLIASLGFGFLSLNFADFKVEPGDLWILGCAVLFAFQILGVDRYCRQLSPFRLNLVQIFSATIICLMASFTFETQNLSGALNVWWPIVFTAIFATTYPFVGQMYAQKFCSPTVAALVLSLESVFAVLFGWWLHDEILQLQEYVGCLIILGGSVLVLLPRAKN